MVQKPEARRLSGEFDLITRYFAPLSGKGAFGLRDDAALYTPRPGHDLIITQDAIHEGIHFLRDDPRDLVAKRALRTNISDMIAKGGTPVSYSLALGLPDWFCDSDVAGLARGLSEDQARYDVYLSGGDTFRSPTALTLSITLIGEVPTGTYRSRLGAKVGDVIAVTGTIGDATLGLRFRLAEQKQEGEAAQVLMASQMLPEPPFGVESIIRKYASASMDVSDGLIGDLRKLCTASHVAGHVEAELVPLLPEARELVDRDGNLADLITGGEDYQTLATFPADKIEQAEQMARNAGLRLTKIGMITGQGDGSVAVTMNGVPMSFERESFAHT